MKIQTRYCASTAEHTHNKCRNMQMCIYIETYISSCNFPQNICLMFNATSIKCGTEKTPTRRHRKMTRPLCLDKSAFPFFSFTLSVRYSLLIFVVSYLIPFIYSCCAYFSCVVVCSRFFPVDVLFLTESCHLHTAGVITD